MMTIQDYILYYEYTRIFDLEGMPQMETSYGYNEIELKVGQFLNLPFYEDNKSFIEKIEEIDNSLFVTLNIPCKFLWENDGSTLVIENDKESRYYYGRTTLNSQIDYYFKFKIVKKN